MKYHSRWSILHHLIHLLLWINGYLQGNIQAGRQRLQLCHDLCLYNREFNYHQLNQVFCQRLLLNQEQKMFDVGTRKLLIHLWLPLFEENLWLLVFKRFQEVWTPKSHVAWSWWTLRWDIPYNYSLNTYLSNLSLRNLIPNFYICLNS